jgi:hypothetical protein
MYRRTVSPITRKLYKEFYDHCGKINDGRSSLHSRKKKLLCLRCRNKDAVDGKHFCNNCAVYNEKIRIDIHKYTIITNNKTVSHEE